MKKSRRRYVYGVLCFIVLFLFTACTSTLQKEKEDNTHYEDYSITDSTIIESQDDNTDSCVIFEHLGFFKLGLVKDVDIVNQVLLLYENDEE